jgi:hypothetical protein
MTGRRQHSKPPTLGGQIEAHKNKLLQALEQLPAGPERAELRRKIREIDFAIRMGKALSLPDVVSKK